MVNKLFWIDNARGVFKTYSEFINDIRLITHIKPVIKESNPYCLWVQLVAAIAFNYPVMLIDGDAPDKGRGIEEETEKGFYADGSSVSADQLSIDNLLARSSDWYVTLLTSGTTGVPKKITQSLDSLCRNVHRGDSYSDNVWGFAYNPAHFGGLQVFFQAYANYNTMIYLFEQDKNKAVEDIDKYSVTNISATPTFFRSLLPALNNANTIMKRITMGGEKFDNLVASKLKEQFPCAEFRNVYATTETGSLLNSISDSFLIKDNQKSKLKVENGSLFVHKDYLANAIDLELVDGWYDTGDLVEDLGNGAFKFMARNTDMINAGGYKINPLEVEEVILSAVGVSDARVRKKENNLIGNIVVADVVVAEGNLPSVVEKHIYRLLQEKLQKWKHPRLIYFVDAIEKTHTGKKDRKK